MFIFDNTMKNCNVKINGSILFECELFPLKEKVHPNHGVLNCDSYLVPMSKKKRL